MVGATENGIVGAKRQTTAAWEQQLGGYLGEGGDAPRWEPVTVTVDDKDVLIFCVEPPLDGDPIFALRAKNGNAEPGTVYARTIEKTQAPTLTNCGCCNSDCSQGASIIG